MQNSLNNLRKKVNKTDEKILASLAARFTHTGKIGVIKAKYNLPIRDAKREKELIEKNKKIARGLGLDEKLVEKIYKLIFSVSCANHKKRKRL